MEEKDFDDLLRSMMEEKSDKDDKAEKNADSIAGFMYTNYKHFLLKGFDHQTALQLTMFLTDRIIFRAMKNG